MPKFLTRFILRALEFVGIRVSRASRRPLKGSWGFSKELRRGGGYWQIDPPPSSASLEDYYRFQYWRPLRGNATPPLLTARDLEHFEVLSSADWMPFGGCFVNFGAGHGGVSFLAVARAMTVINVDPFSARHLTWGARARSDLPRDGRADVIYASHSLEHVSDINLTLTQFAESLCESGIVFLEVPDLSRHWPSSEPPFHEPHTYYFSSAFFESIDCGLTLLWIRHRKQTGSGTLPYSVPAHSREGDVMQIVLKRT